MKLLLMSARSRQVLFCIAGSILENITHAARFYLQALWERKTEAVPYSRVPLSMQTPYEGRAC